MGISQTAISTLGIGPILDPETVGNRLIPKVFPARPRFHGNRGRQGRARGSLAHSARRATQSVAGMEPEGIQRPAGGLTS